MVVLILVLHWTAMHLLTTRWLREGRIASVSVTYIWNNLQAQEGSPDMWRHTKNGWEILKLDEHAAPHFAAPSQHISLAQLWPAAWAACLALSVMTIVTKT